MIKEIVTFVSMFVPSGEGATPFEIFAILQEQRYIVMK